MVIHLWSCGTLFSPTWPQPVTSSRWLRDENLWHFCHWIEATCQNTEWPRLSGNWPTTSASSSDLMSCELDPLPPFIIADYYWLHFPNLFNRFRRLPPRLTKASYCLSNSQDSLLKICSKHSQNLVYLKTIGNIFATAALWCPPPVMVNIAVISAFRLSIQAYAKQRWCSGLYHAWITAAVTLLSMESNSLTIQTKTSAKRSHSWQTSDRTAKSSLRTSCSSEAHKQKTDLQPRKLYTSLSLHVCLSVRTIILYRPTSCLRKNCSKLLMSELRQIVINFNNFWK